MRTYPTNSPQAAARIIAMTALADGNYSMAELDRAVRCIGGRTGLFTDAQFKAVAQAYCEDLHLTHDGAWSSASVPSASVIAAIAREIDDPAMRRSLAGLLALVVHADSHIAVQEEEVIGAILRAWSFRLVASAAPAPDAQALPPNCRERQPQQQMC